VIKVHVFDSDPTLASKSAVSITPYDVAALIRKVHEAGKERSAGILRSTISAAYNCGRRAPFDANLPSTFIEFSIVSNPVDVIPTIPVKARMRTLSPIELKKYIDALGEDTIDMALKLALFSSGQRMAQLLRAEISDWDADRKILRLFDPKGKRKQPREHLLPLGPIAASLVTSLIKKAEERGTRFLLPSSINAPLHDSMLGPRVKEIATAIGGDPFDGRDLRRTAETMLAGLGVSRDVRAQLLSHGISGVQQAHYDKYDYMREKHAALLKWERHLAKILTGDEDRKVIPFNNARRNER
jgi:integrase